MTFLIIVALILLVVYCPYLGIRAAGYLVQKFKFGVPFKEVYAYHKEQDRLEAEARKNK